MNPQLRVMLCHLMGVGKGSEDARCFLVGNWEWDEREADLSVSSVGRGMRRHLDAEGLQR